MRSRVKKVRKPVDYYESYQKWFAWFPVKVYHFEEVSPHIFEKTRYQWIWLETVLRRDYLIGLHIEHKYKLL